MTRTVGVAGAGTMGSGIAQVCATSGYDVVLCDISAAALDRARSAIDRSLAKLVEKGALTTFAREAAVSRLRASRTFDDLGVSDFLVEAIAEDAGAKRALFAAADRLCRPHVILASNTSSIPIAQLAAATARQDRVIGLHFMNPVPLMPLVEVVRGPQTSDETVRVTRDLAGTLGKTAVESADRPGFIANRILMPMINEAVRALTDGVGSAEAIDTVATLGFRHPMGPLALADLIGLDVCVAIMDVMATGFGDEHYRPAPLLCEKVAAGHLGRKSGQGFHSYTGTG